nr:MAG: ribosomal protein L7/L12 C-terminal domain protein [Bacteriophage sp.]
MKQQLITIIALSVDSKVAVLYKEDGSTVTIPQGDARLPLIVEKARGPLSLNPPLPVEVDITPIFARREEFEDAEKGTGGVIKFFRVAKKFLSNLVNTESPDKVDESAAHISPLEIGKLPWKAPVDVAQSLQEMVDAEDEAGTEAWDAKPEGEEAPVPQSVFIEKLPKDYNKVAVIKAVREITGLGLREAKDLVESPQPILVLTNADEESASLAAMLLNRAGAYVEMKPSVPGEKLFALSNDQKVEAAQQRMQQLMGNAKDTSDPEFHAPMKEDETIVAVHTETGAIIPDAHKLGHQLKAASKLQNYTGFTNFVERLSAIIDQRGHSVEDLMKFIEKGDLPIADDGCIIIYKRLNNRGKGLFTDVHSGKIKQKVGSYVFMKPGLVDPSRRQDCSNGLHVASLSYLRQFSGDATVVAKVRPEDVFAVPEYNTNKMRVCGYHILAELNTAERGIVNNGGSLSSTPVGKALLNDIIAGRHVPITQLVEVGGHRGTNVTYTDVKPEDRVQPEVSAAAVEHETLDTEASLDPTVPVADAIEADKLKPVSPAEPEAKAEAKPAKPEEVNEVKRETKAQTAQRLWAEYRTQPSAARLETLVAFKKASKKGWSALGIDDAAVKLIEEETAKAAETTVKVSKVSGFEDVKPVAKKQPKAQSFTSPVKGTGPKAKMAECLKCGVTSVGVAQAALLIKKSAKKSWAALGVSEDLVKQIEAATK